MLLGISMRGRVRTYGRPSVCPSVPSYFRSTNMAAFEDEKSLIDIINTGTMSDDEVVTSDVPSWYFFVWTAF